MAFTLMNDGPGTVKLALNEESGLLDAPVIASGEPYSLDMEWPTIYTLWVEAEEGSSAYLRIFGKEG